MQYPLRQMRAYVHLPQKTQPTRLVRGQLEEEFPKHYEFAAIHYQPGLDQQALPQQCVKPKDAQRHSDHGGRMIDEPQPSFPAPNIKVQPPVVT
jgi:hypothetical protein